MPRRLVAVLLTVVTCLLSPAASQVSANASAAVASGTYTYDGPTLGGAGAAGPRGAGERWQPASFVAPLYAYDDVANVRFRGDVSNGADKRNLQVDDSRRAAGALSETAGGTSTTPPARSNATNTADDFANWDGEFADDAIRAPATRPDFANISAKIERQMQTRGWTPDLIDEAVTSGNKFPAVNKLGGANTPATRYVSPTTGQSVVIDNATGEIIQVGGPGFKYGP